MNHFSDRPKKSFLFLVARPLPHTKKTFFAASLTWRLRMPSSRVYFPAKLPRDLNNVLVPDPDLEKCQNKSNSGPV